MAILQRGVLLLFFLGSSMFSLQAQFIERQLISSYGQLENNEQINVSATAGELVINTLFHEDLILTQGFQQPNPEDLTGLEEPIGLKPEVVVYPNPFMNNLFLEFHSEIKKRISYFLIDRTGRMIDLPVSLVINGTTLKMLKLQHLPGGQYFLIVKDENGGLMDLTGILKM